MTGYRITEQAATDLKDIWCYTANNHGESQADWYVDALKTGCTKIAENPSIWKVLKLAGHDVRVYHCEHHYIVYLTDDVGIVIIAFLHERMNFLARLKARLTMNSPNNP